MYFYIYNRVEMREGPVSHRGTVEGMKVTPSSFLLCCIFDVTVDHLRININARH